jgi:RimJ/RimL family protein N-acetyltransferase
VGLLLTLAVQIQQPLAGSTQYFDEKRSLILMTLSIPSDPRETQSLTLAEVAQFVESRVPFCRPFEGAIVGVPRIKDGALVAAVVWHGYDALTRNCEVAIAAAERGWCSREFLRRAFRVPFEALECRRVTARINVTNTRSRRLCEGLGFVLEGLLRKADVDGGDVLIYGLLKEECRFL